MGECSNEDLNVTGSNPCCIKISSDQYRFVIDQSDYLFIRYLHSGASRVKAYLQSAKKAAASRVKAQLRKLKINSINSRTKELMDLIKFCVQLASTSFVSNKKILMKRNLWKNALCHFRMYVSFENSNKCSISLFNSSVDCSVHTGLFFLYSCILLFLCFSLWKEMFELYSLLLRIYYSFELDGSVAF